MITHRTQNKISFVAMEGEVTQSTIRELNLYVTALLANERPETLILNLQNIYYFDPSGIKEILMLSRAVQKKEVRFAICAIEERLTQKFRNNSLGIHIPIYATEKQALVSNLNRRIRPREPVNAKTTKPSYVPDAWVNIRIPRDILSQIDILANQKNQEQAEIIVEGIREYVENREKKQILSR